MRYCGHFLIKAEGGAKNYERDYPLPLSWRPFTVVFLQRKGYTCKWMPRYKGMLSSSFVIVMLLVLRNNFSSLTITEIWHEVLIDKLIWWQCS